VFAGLARAAENRGRLDRGARQASCAWTSRIRCACASAAASAARIQRKVIRAEQVLLATTQPLWIVLAARAAEPKLTFCACHRPLSAARLKLSASPRATRFTPSTFLIYGTLLESNGVIFGAGLVPASNGTPFGASLDAHSGKNGSHDLHRYDVRRGEAVGRLRCSKPRPPFAPALASVRITHRWAARFSSPKKCAPSSPPSSQQHVMVLAGYNGHGVALSVYLGKWAAEALLHRRPSLPGPN